MKCPKCDNEMEQGFLAANGTKWKSGTPSTIYKIMVGNPAVGKWLDAIAWRCSKCGKIELIAK